MIEKQRFVKIIFLLALLFVFISCSPEPDNYVISITEEISISISSDGTKIDTTVSPQRNVEITWSVEDETIAIVDSDGIVIPKNIGTTNVIAKTKDGIESNKCKVTVIEDTQRTFYLPDFTTLASNTINSRGLSSMGIFKDDL